MPTVAEYRDLESKVIRLEDSNTELEGRFNKAFEMFKEASEDATTSSNEVLGLHNNIVDKAERIVELTGELATSRGRIRTLKTESENRQLHINELAEENAGLLDRNEELEEMVEILRTTIVNMALDNHGPPPPYSEQE